MSELVSSGPGPLGEFVTTRSYLRWIPEEGRRETWDEAATRYIGWIQAGAPLPEDVAEAALRAIQARAVLPSMRGLWGAGPALDRCNVGLYNCTFLPLDCLPAFAELLYILMQGTGAGFSVESRFVERLPEVARRPIAPPTGAVEVLARLSQAGTLLGVSDLSSAPTRARVVVLDTTEGWADALLAVLTLGYLGVYPHIDYSQVRPEGAPLTVKGGRASGPEPLRRLLDFAQAMLRKAAGRRLRPVEAHDIACMVGEIVMAGGVRRSALISISDRDDEDMRHAKDWSREPEEAAWRRWARKVLGLFGLGAWAPTKPPAFPECRYMANNSAFYDARPSREDFDREWAALVASGSGERGMLHTSEASVRARGGDYRTNPCVTGDMWVATDRGARQVRDLVGVPFTAIVDGQAHPSTSEGFWSTGVKPVVRVSTKEGYSIDMTTNHVLHKMSPSGFIEVQAGDMVPGDMVRLHNHRSKPFINDPVEHARGWLIGALLGDGTFTQHHGGKQDSAHLRFWGDDGEVMANKAFELMKLAELPLSGDARPHFNKAGKFWEVSSVALGAYAKDLGMVPAAKTVTPTMEKGTESFVAGLLSGIFDTDGSVQGGQERGVSVRITQVNEETLRSTQRMLARFGVISTLYRNRRPAMERELPDGRGSTKMYKCQAYHEVAIANDSLLVFRDKVNFLRPRKAEQLTQRLGGYRRALNASKFTARVSSVEPVGEAEVFDCTVPGIGFFDCSAFYAHNCGEIRLRFTASSDPWTGAGGGGQGCNLSAAVLRADDTWDSALDKVRLAAWLGTAQATFTDFAYLRPAWARLCREDRLLGVDITGQCDAPHLAFDPVWLTVARHVAEITNNKAARWFGINPAKAVTCGKPSGNSSQAVNCSSGFHPRWSAYYIRRVRIARTDPLFRLIRDRGVPVHKDTRFRNTPDEECPTWVAEFPVAAPPGAMLRGQESAIQMLERYAHIMRTWCGGERSHNQSVTIYVRPEEWQEVGEWVWANFDMIGGLSFLPYDSGGYELAPYEEITAERYAELAAAMPDIDYAAELPAYEREDMGMGAQEYACVGGACEIDYSAISATNDAG